MRRSLLLIALVVASCSNGAPAGTSSSTQSPSTAKTATASPAPTGCRLPLWLYDRSTNIGTANFLQVPGAVLVAAQPAVTSPNVLAAYVPVAKRWVPVARSLVSPNGSYYAYNETSGNPEVDRLHVVDLATSADHVIAQGGVDGGYEAFDVEADGIYAGRAPNGPATLPGLWRLDPKTGAATRLDATQRWQWISGGYAFATVPNSTDPVVVQGGPLPDTLLRLDLRTGAVQEWFRKRGVFPNVIGFDWNGRPLVILGQTLGDLVVVTGASSVQPIAGGTPDVTFSQVIPSLVAFSDGFWFTADQGLFSYSGNVGFQKMWSNGSSSGLYVEVAGPCG
jgi:hypothetical protein